MTVRTRAAVQALLHRRRAGGVVEHRRHPPEGHQPEDRAHGGDDVGQQHADVLAACARAGGPAADGQRPLEQVVVGSRLLLHVLDDRVRRPCAATASRKASNSAVTPRASKAAALQQRCSCWVAQRAGAPVPAGSAGAPRSGAAGASARSVTLRQPTRPYRITTGTTGTPRLRGNQCRHIVVLHDAGRMHDTRPSGYSTTGLARCQQAHHLLHRGRIVHVRHERAARDAAASRSHPERSSSRGSTRATVAAGTDRQQQAVERERMMR